MMPEVDRKRCVSCGQCARVCPMGVITFENGVLMLHADQPCLECWHCAAVCPRKAIAKENLDLYLPVPEEKLERLVTTRRAVRHFKPEPPAKEVIVRALECAAWAPAGKNRRTYGWTVLYGRARVEKLLESVLDWAASTPEFEILTKAARGNCDLVTCGAPCIILGHNKMDAINAETDTVIAAATAELLLVERGIGTCWGGYLRWALSACPATGELLDIPEGHRVYTALLVGTPDGELYCNLPYRPQPEIKWC